MKNKFLIIALTTPLLLVGCDSEKFIKEKTAAKVERLATPLPKKAEKKPQTPEEIVANTKKVMDQMNDQASSGRHGQSSEGDGTDEAAKLATRKMIEEAAKSTTEDTEKAMQEAAKNALEASEKVGGTSSK